MSKEFKRYIDKKSRDQLIWFAGFFIMLFVLNEIFQALVSGGHLQNASVFNYLSNLAFPAGVISAFFVFLYRAGLFVQISISFTLVVLLILYQIFPVSLTEIHPRTVVNMKDILATLVGAIIPFLPLSVNQYKILKTEKTELE